jgi:hypothetical protein
LAELLGLSPIVLPGVGMAGEDLYRIAYGFLEGLDGGSFV